MKNSLIVSSLLALIFFGLYPSVDIYFSSFFYDAEVKNFPLRENILSLIIYYSVRIFTFITLAICIFVITYESKFTSRLYKHILPKLCNKTRGLIALSKEKAWFLFLVIIITPGILVHWIMKPIWDRARPVNTEIFGGNYKFSYFYELFAGQDGNSFPSGHASMSFAMVAFAYIVKEEKRKLVFAITFLYGFLASFCRIWQGGHFLSDVVFSAIITLWTIYFVRKYYLDRFNG
ncbi:MAG: phosphatase PAP2 family protein [Rickettsiales bacterium]|nr:phosphatase PAP2 family protein [Rickettsiales bacterium]